MSQKHRGFSLVELMFTLSILLILMATVSPGLIDMVKNNRMTTLHNDLMGDLALTRSTAVTRGNNATLCASNIAGTQCVNQIFVWSSGWLVFDDLDNDGIIDKNEAILAAKNDISNKIQMIGTNSRISFDPEGSAFGFSSEFAFCDSRGEELKRGLIVSNSGRSRVAEANEIGVACL